MVQKWFCRDPNTQKQKQKKNQKNKLANVPKPIKWLSKCCHWGKYGLLLARPLRPTVKPGWDSLSLWGCIRLRWCKWLMGWRPLGQKRKRNRRGSMWRADQVCPADVEEMIKWKGDQGLWEELQDFLQAHAPVGLRLPLLQLLPPPTCFCCHCHSWP